MPDSALTISTLSTLSRSFKSGAQLSLVAAPGATGAGTSEPEDDTRPLTEITVKHAKRKTSQGSRDSRMTHRERQRNHEREPSNRRGRASRPHAQQTLK